MLQQAPVNSTASLAHCYSKREGGLRVVFCGLNVSA